MKPKTAKLAGHGVATRKQTNTHRPADTTAFQSTAELDPAPQPTPAGQRPARAGSKRALMLELLQRPQGAALAELVAATGWLPHTTRAALTGLRKRGLRLERSKAENGKSSYRITAPVVAEQAAPSAAEEA